MDRSRQLERTAGISSQSLAGGMRAVGFLIVVLFCSAQLFAEEATTYGGYTLSEWQEIVKSTDFKTLGDPQTVAGLLEIVVDVNAPWANRRQAAKTLGRIGQPAAKAVPLLKQILLHPPADQVENVSTRLWVLSALSLFRTVASEVTPEVSQLILDKNQPLLLRINAMETLGRIGKESELALTTFATILKKEHVLGGQPPRELRLAAAEAVWILGPSAAPLLPLLIDNARDDWSPIRLASIVTIGEIGPRAEIAIPLLIDTLLFDEAGEVKEVAADALGKLGRAALPALSKLQNDYDEDVRRYVIRALQQMPNSPAVHRLLQNGLADDFELTRIDAAIELLTRLPAQASAMQILLDSLGSKNRRARLNAYNAIYVLLPKSETLQIKLAGLAQDSNVSGIQSASAKKLLKKIEFDQQ